VPATFSTRFVAWIIDNIIVGIAAGIMYGCSIAMLIGLASTNSDALTAIGVLVFFAVAAIAIIFGFVYFGYFWSKDGQSPGMRMMNIQVVQRDGALQSFVRAGLRGSVGYWISGLIFWMGYWWALLDAAQETWHDKIFDTKVVMAGTASQSASIAPAYEPPPAMEPPPAPPAMEPPPAPPAMEPPAMEPPAAEPSTWSSGATDEGSTEADESSDMGTDSPPGA
jgi:uncharacterized RDD family membrane protein YckC